MRKVGWEGHLVDLNEDGEDEILFFCGLRCARVRLRWAAAMIRALTAVVLVATFAAAAALAIFPPVGGGGTFAAASGSCGVERWAVKTLRDRPRLLPAASTTIHFLVKRPAPPSLPVNRLPFERHVYMVTAAVTLVRQEQDGDLHLVLQAGADHMIAEAPSPSCDSRATPLRHGQMTAARTHVRLCAHAHITGVAFFDFDHGQTGVAPNAIELHPILGFRCS